MYVSPGNSPDYSATRNVYCYNTKTDHWTVLPQSGHRCGVLLMLDDKLTIFGGMYPPSNKVSTYNNDTNTWYSCYPNMLYKRGFAGVIAYHNYVIVMGGIGRGWILLDSIEVMEYHYHLQWKEVSVRLPVPMWDLMPTISGDSIIIVGYYVILPITISKRCFRISPEEIICSLCLPCETPTQWEEFKSATHYDTATVPYSNPPVIVGGNSHSDQNNIRTSDIALYDNSKNSWRKVDSLTSARNCVAVALLNNNTIMVIGGATNGIGVKSYDASSLSTVEKGTIVPNQ